MVSNFEDLIQYFYKQKDLKIYKSIVESQDIL